MIDQILGTNFTYEESKEVARGLENFSAKLAIVYIMVIFGLKNYMKGRNAFDLTVPLCIWNGILSIFSLIGFVLMTPTLISVITTYGFSHTYSHVSELYTDSRSGYWVFLWVLSKIPELLDTVFIVLRKRPLIFMHWYHHALTGYYSLVCYHEDAVHMIWIVWMNYIIHAVMYGYYLLKSVKVYIPPSVAQALTTTQMVQFSVGIFAQLHVSYKYYIQKEVGLAYSFRATAIGFFMLSTYFYLWVQFYKEHYLHNGGRKYNLAKKEQKKAE